jgi:wyosine [tRNA(Phe)-imidazoG37] synthetase (radical SAM superfamily)
LGINLSPCDRKLCSFSCVYCHYGDTERLTDDVASVTDQLPSAELVLEVVDSALRSWNELDAITFSGNGEPTLHPEFPAIARGVAELVERHRPTLRTVLLSNSTTLYRSEIRQALEHVDVPVLKLDAGTEEAFRAINRPARGIRFDTVVDELTLLDNFTLQTLLIDGTPSNSTEAELDNYFRLVGWIVPDEVQLYSTDRPVAKSSVGRVPPRRLRQIAQQGMERTGIPFRVFAA